MAKKEQTQDSKSGVTPNIFERFFNYIEASRAELRKVTWPSWQETRRSTIAVLAFVAVMALILGLIDLGLSSLVKAILS